MTLIFITNSKPALACDTEIKKTDGYKELSEKLKCLNTKIELVYKKTPDFDRQTIVLFEPSKPIDIKTKKCLKTSTLPDQFRLVLRDGMKFCQDDGWTWGRGVAGPHYYDIKFTDKRRDFSC